MKVKISNKSLLSDCSLSYITTVPTNTKMSEFIDYSKELSLKERSITIHVRNSKRHLLYTIEVKNGAIKSTTLPKEYYDKIINSEIPSNDGWGFIYFDIFF